MSNVPQVRIGFVGAGKMATALAQGWLQAGLTAAEHLQASDPILQARNEFAQATGAKAAQDNRQVVSQSDLIVLAVKPQTMQAVLAEIRSALSAQHLILSIAAGVSLAQLSRDLGPDKRVVRAMPNTPCLVGASASGYAAGPAATPEDLRVVDRLLKAVGKAFALPEKLLDAVTGLSGSGPAYIFVLIEALSDGGVRMGLPRDVATQLAAQTVFGSAKMLLETGLHPAVLKDQVASPGGTTMAGLHALERGGFRAALIDAVEAATNRSVELGRLEPLEPQFHS
ncbi:MAG: pyrroline-5-carboxylate reductase [Gemmataceae bacterium]|nr:pyrroline-5-carboxylate reductase [Gemmataceae bacterium]